MAKILLVEDDVFLRDIYTEMFTSEGFEVQKAIDGEEALVQIVKGGWDLVLLDVIMPKLSGVEVLKRLESRNLHSYTKKIVLMTNSDEQRELKDALTITDGYLLKSSYTPDQLLIKVKEFLS